MQLRPSDDLCDVSQILQHVLVMVALVKFGRPAMHLHHAVAGCHVLWHDQMISSCFFAASMYGPSAVSLAACRGDVQV